MQSKDAGGEGDQPKSAELEELLWRWSQGFLSLGFSRGEGFLMKGQVGKGESGCRKARNSLLGLPEQTGDGKCPKVS